MTLDPDRARCPHAREVLQILADGSYVAADGARVDISSAQRAALQRTRLFEPDELARLVEAPGPEGTPARASVEVADASSQVAAQQLAARGPVAVLNYASALNPGGGFLIGARAQEEDLCRCSGLYPTLLRQPRYYELHHAHGDHLYTDAFISSESVPFFRIATDAPRLASPFLATVITAPAPNAGFFLHDEAGGAPRIEPTFARRWPMVLAATEALGLRSLVLGAWGCGAFRNDPVMVARTARDAVHSARFAGSFEHLVFAIPGNSDVSRRNLEVFREVLAS